MGEKKKGRIRGERAETQMMVRSKIFDVNAGEYRWIAAWLPIDIVLSASNTTKAKVKRPTSRKGHR